MTAAHRGTRCLVSQLTTGSRPAAMNSASPMSTSTERALMTSSTRPMVTATPAAPVIPMKNGERRSIGRPSRPRLPVSSACFAATRAASRIEPRPGSDVSPSPSPAAASSSLPPGDSAPGAARLAGAWPVPRAASLTRPGLSPLTPACPPGRGPRRWPGLPAVARVLLVAYDRLLAEVVVAACWHRLVPALVDARPVPGLARVVAGLALGRALALVLPAPLALPRAVALAVFPSPRPVHLPTPSHCAGGMPRGAPPARSLAMGVTTTPGFAALTSRRRHRPPFAAAAAGYRRDFSRRRSWR